MTASTLTQKRIKNVVIGVLAVWAAQVGMASAAVTTAPGLMAGQFDVDSKGAATYAIPIEVPPGKGGMEPHLALKYNSQKGNGLLGVGWTLEGLGAIQRCGGNIGTDGVKSGIDKTAERFCWNGQRLINISTQPGHPLKDSFSTGCDGSLAAVAEYRTQIDTYARVLSCGGTAKNPSYFVAYTKDGQKLKFGTRTDSNVKVSGGTETLVWAMDRQENRVNDYLEIYYTKWAGSPVPYIDSPGTYFPKFVVYTGNGEGTTATKPRRAVQFNYVDRTSALKGTNYAPELADPVVSYVAGGAAVLQARLSSVDTFSAIPETTLFSSATSLEGTKANSYKLTYATSPTADSVGLGADRRSRISRVERCSGDGTICLPATRFIAGSEPDAAGKATSPIFSSARMGDFSVGKSTQSRMLDVDGDGATDIVTISGTAITINLSPGVSGGVAPPSNKLTISGASEWIEIVDVNGDGVVDILVGSKAGSLDSTDFTTKSKGDLAVYFGELAGDGSSRFYWASATLIYPKLITYGLDEKNADGTYMYPGSAPQSLRRFNQFADLDGDGTVEILRGVIMSDGGFPGRWESVTQQYVSDGISKVGSSVDLPCNFDQSRLESSFRRQCVLADMDGDGLPDLVSSDPRNTETLSTLHLVVRKGNGLGGFNAAVIYKDILPRITDEVTGAIESFTANTQLADLNGDGVLDVATTTKLTNAGLVPGNLLRTDVRYWGDGTGAWNEGVSPKESCSRAEDQSSTACTTSMYGVAQWFDGYTAKMTLSTYVTVRIGGNLGYALPVQSLLSNEVPVVSTLTCPTTYKLAPNSINVAVGVNASSVTNSSGTTYQDYCYPNPDPSKLNYCVGNQQTGYKSQTVTPLSYALNCTATYAVDSKFEGVSASNRYVDINGDGNLDLVSLRKSYKDAKFPSVYAEFGLGGTFSTVRRVLLDLSETTADPSVVQAFEHLVDLQDMDGDGLTDIVVHTATGLRVYYAQYVSPTRIITIDTNNGAAYNIEYARHSGDHKPQALANQTVRRSAGMYVVKNYQTSLGGVVSNVDMRYDAWVENLKYSVGTLGKLVKIQTSLTPNRATEQIFSTVWPYIGRVEESRILEIPNGGCRASGVWMSSCTILSETVTEYDKFLRSNADGQSSVFQVLVYKQKFRDDNKKETQNLNLVFNNFGDVDYVYTYFPVGSSVSQMDTGRFYTRRSSLNGYLGDPSSVTVITQRGPSTGVNEDRDDRKEYNSSGQLTSEAITSTTSQLGLKRTYTYYPTTDTARPGMLYTVEESGENGDYDTTGAVAKATQKRTTTYSYANLFSGDPEVTKTFGALSEATVTDGKTGQRKSVKDNANSVGSVEVKTSWTYDDFGRPLTESRPDNTSTSIVYSTATGDPDTYSSAVNATQMAGVAYVVIATPKDSASGSAFPVKTIYDGFGRKMRTVSRAADGDRVYADYAYDLWGRLISETKPYIAGSIGLVSTSYEYDLLDRNTLVRRSHAGKTTTSYDAFDATLNARLITTTEQRGDTDLITQRYIDSEGRTVKIIDASNIATEYFYTLFGELKTVKRNGAQVVTHEYDGLGFRTKTTDTDLGIWEFRYNAWGELKWQKDAKAQITSMTYDSLGRLTQRSLWPVGRTQQWVYDKVPVSRDNDSAGERWQGQGTALAGRLIEVRDANSFWEEHLYDNFGREIGIVRTIDGLRYVTGVTYDSYGRTRDLSYPSGGPVIRHEYYPNGALKSIGELSATGETTPVWSATARDAAGRVTGESFGSNKLTGSRSYNAQFGLTETIQTDSLQNLSYNYDKLGNMTWRQDIRQGVKEDFSYDNVNRLDIVKRNGSQSADFDFDINGHGNLVKNDLGTLNYSGSRLHAVNSVGSPNAAVALGTLGDTNQDKLIDASDVSNAALYAIGQTSAISDINKPKADCVASGGTIDILDSVCIAKLVGSSATPTMGYDNNGNLTSGQGRSIRYTPFNQPAAIDGIAASTSYQYDAYFNRITKQSSSAGVITTTTYIGDLYEKTQTASGTEHRFYIYAGGRLVSLKKRETDDKTNLYYILTDHLGSVDVIADSAGTELVRLSFDAYGQRRNINWTAGTGIAGTSITTRGFTGAEMEDEVGLVHLGARMYDAKLGRFLTPDSIIPDVENGQSLNRYSYVLNNPLSWVDPSGHVPILTNSTESQPSYSSGGSDMGVDYVFGPVSTAPFLDITGMVGSGGGSAQGFGEAMQVQPASPWNTAAGFLKAIVPGYGYSVAGFGAIGRGEYVTAAANFGAMGAEIGMALSTGGASQVEMAAARSTATSRSADWFEDVARNATRNPDSNKLVLGHFARDGSSYQKVAAHYEATYFKVDDWNAVTKGLLQDEIWRINETFLTQQLRQGKQVLFSHDPINARPGSFFEREVNFMQELGYGFRQKSQWTWEAVR